jgi:preprotein translocase subunit Sss1
MRQEFLSWLRVLAMAGAVVGLIGLLITAGRPVLELVALR